MNSWIIADSYFLTLNLLDDCDTTHKEVLAPVAVLRDGGSVTLETHLFLSFRRLWNYTILAYGCEEHPIIETTQLSTVHANLNCMP